MPTDNRPLSPHLQIYRWQLTMALSILHRATGIALSVGAILLVYWLVAAAAGPETFADAQAFFGSWFGLILLLGWTWAIFYHLAAGIRHLVWDAGFGLELGAVYTSGWIVVVASFALTALAWIVGLLIYSS
jgi:succinate dehydrogenase / fumarate reductase cytochrome b subunit